MHHGLRGNGRPWPTILCNTTVGVYTLHGIIEINMKTEICESRTPTLLSMISLEIDFVNVYYNILINTAVLYMGIIAILSSTCMIHWPSWPPTLTVYTYSSF